MVAWNYIQRTPIYKKRLCVCKSKQLHATQGFQKRPVTHGLTPPLTLKPLRVTSI